MSSYPPAHHVLRDLGFSTERVHAEHTIVRAPLTPSVRLADGSVAMGVLACLVDVTGAMIALASVAPDWIATADMAVHARGPIVEGPIVMNARPVRLGKNIAVVGCELRDGMGSDAPAAGVAAGMATMTFSRLPGSATVVDRSDAAEPDGAATTLSLPDSGFAAPFREALGIRSIVTSTPGTLELDNREYVRNSFGTINGGVVAAIMEAAGEAAGRAATGAPVVSTDLQVHFLAQTKVGPVRTTVDVLRVGGEAATVRVELHDRSTSSLVALATVGTAVLGSGSVPGR